MKTKMKTALAFFAVGLCLLAMTRSLAAEEDAPAALPSTGVTPAMLESKIAEIEAAADLQDETKTRFVELYRKALSNLQEANASAERAAAFMEATRTAPTQTQHIREQIEAVKSADPVATLDVSLETPLEQIEPQLKKEQADLAAVDAQRADFEKRLTFQASRSATISQRLAETKPQQDNVTAALGLPPEASEGPALSQAKRWVLETKYLALSNEMKMLDQELLSQPMRLDLLKAKRDKEAASFDWIQARIRVLSDLVNRQRRLQAEQAKIEAEQAQRETVGLDPLLMRLAERNAVLSDELHAMVARLDRLDQEKTQAAQLAKRIEADYQDAEVTLKTAAVLTTGLGQLLQKHRQSLPDFQVYARRAREREQRIAEVSVQRLLHREEARRLVDPQRIVAELETELTAEKTPRLRAKLRELVTQRQALLKKALEEEDFYLRKLRELDAAESELIEAARRYDDLLSEHLLWLRSAERTQLEDLMGLPDEARRLLSPAIWSGLFRVFYDQVTRSPVFWLVLLVVAALLWKRRALIGAIEKISARLGRPSTDRFAYTFRALVVTLVIAAPLSLLLAAAGWQLRVTAQGTDLSHALGASLLVVALQLYVLRALHTMCIPQGLAVAHFRWPESGVQRLRVELDRLTWLFIPALLIGRFAIDLNPAATGGTIARLAFLVYFTALTLFLYRVLHPKRGVLVHLRLVQKTGVLFRTYPLWFSLLLAFPLGLVAMALSGYTYTATTETSLFLNTLGLIAGLMVLHALAMRWLLVVRRRLAYKAALERRQAALAAKQAEGSESGGEETSALQVEEPEVDLTELSDDSRELIKIAIIFAGLIGLYLIWSPVLPALRILDSVTFWYQTVTVDGEDKRLPITLADIGLALIYAVGTVVLAKRLPAMLEIILLRRFDMSSGSRYTVTTLSTYAVMAVGILLVFNTLGAQWSQLQWLVAALGVGIGFGLQEIVANFISGLIILFERPIRIGDIVTVGDTDGVVTNIRIRATTIRNWDRKELLVPNKEFITGRLLNWSLSDQITRILIMVGVAYGTDVDKALALMKEAAEEHEYVLDEPGPVPTFEGFGDNSLALFLRAYVNSVDYRLATITGLHKAINRKFQQAGIVIAFPQRDLHLDAREPLRVSIEDARQEIRD